MAKRSRKTISNNLVDIVIPVCGHLDLLKKCLDCIPDAAGEVSYRIQIHDNGTPKEEKGDFYRTLDPDIYVMQSTEGLGFPKACNMASRKSSAPLILFLNTDVFLQKDAILNMSIAMSDPKVGIAGAKLLFDENSKYGPPGMVQHVGLEFNIRAEPFHQFIGWTPDNPKVLAKTEAFAVTGAVFMIRRNLWRELGGFFEGYGLGTYEDLEMCVKVRQLGYNIRVVQEAIGYHMVGGSEAQYALNNNRSIFMGRNQNAILYSEWRWW